MNDTTYRDRYLRALREGNETAARAVVDDARAAGVSPAHLYFEVFAPTMVTIGTLWEQNELTVAEEHLATAITERLIGLLSPSFSPHAAERGTPSTGGTVVLGCAAGERHVLGVHMLADLFRERGWRVLDLGADVPTSDWVDFVKRYEADAVAIAATAVRYVAALETLISQLKAARPDLIILVGGAVFDQHAELWQVVGANMYRRDPVEAVRLVSEQYAAAHGSNVE